MRLLFIVGILLAISNCVFAEDFNELEEIDQTSVRKAFLLQIDGVIGPATADYFERSLHKVNTANTELILLRMDTPGGLDLSMRKIIKSIIASPVPVVTYVAPSGSRAASAGTYILYASHVAAMAPGTNLGAATPVQMIPSGGLGKDDFKPGSGTVTNPDKDTGNKAKKEGSKEPDLKRSPQDPMMMKIINDAVAYIQSLAKMRGRNVEWAEQAVRSAASLPAEEALKKNVIDIIATSQADLFKQLNGRKVNVLGEEKTLNTSGLILTEIEPDWRNKLLEVITNPNIAYILMLVGIYGLIIEFSNPGAILPGTVGAISLLLALFAFQVLPINYAGLALIILGIALMIGEAFAPSFGVLGLGGVVAFVIGSIILIDTDLPGYGIDMGLIIGFAITSAILFILAMGLVFKARRNPIVSGEEEMIGTTGEVLDNFDQLGKVRVHSEIWTARSDTPMNKGEKARVETMDGLTLVVKPEKTTEISS